MNKWMKALLAVALMGASYGASAALVLLGTTAPGNALNPAAGDTGLFGEQACPTPQACPTSGNSISGDDTIWFSITSNGIMNIAFVPSITPDGSGVFTFTYTVLDPSSNVISTGLPQTPPNFGVSIGTGYQIDLHWVFTSNDSPSSAAFAMSASTGAPRKVPEPMTLALIGVALAGLGFARRRQS